MLSLGELKQINNEDEEIEIASPNFFTDEYLIHHRMNKMNEHPKDISIGQYAGFFTLDKMENTTGQCQAIKDFLADYAKNSFWTRRTHKLAVMEFLEQNKNENNIENLLTKMEKSLATQAERTQG